MSASSSYINTPEKFGSRLYVERLRAGMSRGELSRRSKVSMNTIRNHEQIARYKILQVTLDNLCAVFPQLSPDYEGPKKLSEIRPRCAGQGCERAERCYRHHHGNGRVENYASRGCQQFQPMKTEVRNP